MLLSNQPGVAVEEYHGNAHQVRFTGDGIHSRSAARCELSDLAVIVYDRVAGTARLTYIQAKSERLVKASRFGIAGATLSADLEQWHLLSSRPKIQGVNRFSPPSDLLSNSSLGSIGSYVFFVHGAKSPEIYYASASKLPVAAIHSVKRGKLLAQANLHGVLGSVPECYSAYSTVCFGAALLGMTIGNPLLDKRISPGMRNWLASRLRAMPLTPSGLSQELAERLSDEAVRASDPSLGARTTIVIGLSDLGDSTARAKPADVNPPEIKR
ncbi:MAG: hypothetical protein KC561_09085 [Myxococcales bacterium]|nr:hypothetical protein [Myxococcales bacterium]